MQRNILFSPLRLLQTAKWNQMACYNLHTTCINSSDDRRNRGQRLAEYNRRNANRFGPLTNLPDYTYMDGRPTPLGIRQMSRVKYQRELAQKIVTAIDEVDFAKERYKRMQQEEADERKAIIDGKLKPKGEALLKK